MPEKRFSGECRYSITIELCNNLLNMAVELIRCLRNGLLCVTALFPVFIPRCFTNAGIHTVCRVILAIKLLKCLRGFVKMPNVVFRRILCATFAQKGRASPFSTRARRPFLTM